MKNEIKKIKKELSLYLSSIEEDVFIPVNKAHENASNKVALSKQDLMNSLAQEVSNCRKCLLGLSRLNAVFGCGDPNTSLMFIGEGPGFEEDHTGQPFVGRAGQLLDKIIAAMGLSREKVYIANIVKCHPMIDPENPDLHGNDRPPTPAEISMCRGYLERQIDIISPRAIVTLGNVPTKFMLNETKGISQLRGKSYQVPQGLFSFKCSPMIFPTYHPAALLRNPNLKKDTWADMKAVMSFLGLK